MSNLNSLEPKHAWNCLSCRHRKLRCDRGKPPCSNCEKAERECVFPTAGRAFQRPEQRSHAKARVPRTDSELLDRLRRLEAVVEGLNSELESSRSPKPDWPENIRPDKNRYEQDVGPRHQWSGSSGPSFSGPTATRAPAIMAASGFGARDGVYVGDSFWSMLRREITIVRETFAELEGEQAEVEPGFVPRFLPSHRGATSDSSAFLFGNNHNSAQFEDTLERLRPSPPHLLFIWQTFLDNVSPVIHILHVPSVQKLLRDCRYRCEELGPNMEPLLFAVSFTTVTILTTEEVQINFGRDKKQFLAELRCGTEQALARADFINTSSISVVQALTLYLACIRWSKSARYAWTLVGLLVRIAVSIGLHRDGSHFPNISRFEVENRRRVWWHICCFDERLSDGQVPGFGISQMGFDTLPPSNVNDDDLEPAMTAPPASRKGHTDTSFTLIRYETWHFMRTIRSLGSEISSGHLDADRGVQSMLTALHDFQLTADERFGTHPDESLHLAITKVFQLNFKLWELIIRHQRPPLTQESLPDDDSFGLALSVLEDIALVQHSPSMRRVSWFLNGQVQWQPCAIILSRISSLPWDDVAEHAWNLVTGSLFGVSEVVQTDPVWQPLRILLNKAHRHRERRPEHKCQDSQATHSDTGRAPSSPPRLVSSTSLQSMPLVTPVATPVIGDKLAEETRHEERLNISAQLADVGAYVRDSGDDNIESFNNIPGGDAADIDMEDLNLLAWNEFIWAGAPIY